MSIYVNNNYNVELVRTLLQHSSIAVTQHYLSVQPEIVERALAQHIKLPA
jgi:site-specific recombinase XerD